jgi:hypothetical protein
MRPTCGLVLLSGLLILVSSAWGQTTSTNASAQPASRSSGQPSALEIQENALNMQLAQIEGDLREVKRCISNASNPQVLRDFNGNINRVPQVDLVDCSRRLKQLERQLAGLKRQATSLSLDAQYKTQRLQRVLSDVTRVRRTQKGQKD